VTLDYASWSPTQIVIAGFGKKYGSGPAAENNWRVHSGDEVMIEIAKAGGSGLKRAYTVAPPTFAAVWSTRRWRRLGRATPVNSN
jgi:hypothetical protein